MLSIPFNVDANTARIIGRENVSKMDGAVIELVKNAYDADAVICILYYEKTTSTLYIADNGSGMSDDIIRNRWMTIGYSVKKEKHVSKNGRKLTGSKGIGRFALDRLAQSCNMLTRQNGQGLRWEVNWDDFEYGKKITDITAILENTEIDFSEFISTINNQHVKILIDRYFNNSGTIFKLTNLNDDWNNTVFEALRQNLSSLTPPGFEKIFKLYLFDEIIDAANAIISNDSERSYDYKIDFAVTNIGTVDISIIRNEFDTVRLEKVIGGMNFKDANKELEYFRGEPITKSLAIHDLTANGQMPLSLPGEFSGTFYFLKGSIPKSEAGDYFYKETGEHKNINRFSGGIRIYRDSFRVRPYGDPNSSTYDWLSLSNRSSRSPAGVTHKSGNWRVRADQIYGYVNISQELNPTLPDQSNREGIIETPEFYVFKQILVGIIQIFERERQNVFRTFREWSGDKKHQPPHLQIELTNKLKQGDELLRDLQSAKTEEERKKIEGKLENIIIPTAEVVKLLKKRDQEIADLRDENSMLYVLATIGIATNSYVHEIKTITHNIVVNGREAKELLLIDKDSDKAVTILEENSQECEKLTSWFDVTLESIKKSKRTLTSIELKPMIEKYVDNWKTVLYDSSATINCSIPDEMILNGYPYEIESIISNLLTNSNSAFIISNTESPSISITFTHNKTGEVVFIYSDNGPGLNPKYKANPDLILESFQTDKANPITGEIIGTGMGMWIIKNIVDKYNGSIDLSKNTTAESGFTITITLRKRRQKI